MRSRRPSLCAAAGATLVAMAGCATHPDAMHVDRVGLELVPSTRYIATRPAGEVALALLFTGQAPFAAIVRDGRQPQFECELHDAAGAQVSQFGPGNLYFDGPAMPADPATGLVDMAQGESYRYRAVLYFGLKARTTVNGPDDLDLLHSAYDHVACRLRGAQMLSTIWMSNDLVIPKGEITQLAERAAPRR